MGRVAASGMDIRNWPWSCRVLYVSGCLFLTRRKKEALPCLLFGRSILEPFPFETFCVSNHTICRFAE